MAYKPIYSRAFLEKVFSWSPELQRMAFEAAIHACLDPDLHDYKRPYITPYRQKHPTTDRQYTLYFLVVSATEVFFTWINDTSCLHDTRNELTDPCLKEFKRQRLEVYDPLFHQIVFEVHPDKKKPFRCRSRLLGAETIVNTYFLQPNSYISHSFSCDEAEDEIAKIHVSQFLKKLCELLNNSGIDFQFQITKLGHQREILLLVQAYDPTQWSIVDDDEDFILKKI
jgi:hypothetical protein